MGERRVAGEGRVRVVGEDFSWLHLRQWVDMVTPSFKLGGAYFCFVLVSVS